MQIWNRDQLKQKVINSLETDMEYLGSTGVEDKLQDNCIDTIQNIKSAGIKVWMLTGDKMETSECIAISTELKKLNQNFFRIKNLTSAELE